MKKITTIILTLCVLLSLVGCSSSPDNYSSYYEDDYYYDDENQVVYDDITIEQGGSTTNNSTSNNNNVNNSTNSHNNTNNTASNNSNKNNGNTQNNNVNIELIYQKENRDRNLYDNWVRIDKIETSNGRLFISYTATKYNGDGYNAFATQAIFYDANNNILDIKQVMYISNLSNSVIGKSFVDDTYIPDGTRKILINSGTTATKPLISTNHGNPNIKINIPSICFDKNNYGNSVVVNSYNVYDGQIFTTYTPKDYYGGGYTAHAVEMVFYNSSGSIIDTKQSLYVGNFDVAIGCTYFDYTYIPDGTASIGIQMGAPSSGSSSNNSNNESTTSSTPSQSTSSEDDGKWSYSDAKKLDEYIKKAADALTNAKNNYSKGSAFKVLAASYVNTADGYIESAITLIESKSDITLNDGSTLLGKCKDAHEFLSQLDGVTLNTDNIDEHSETVRQMCYQGAVDVGSIRILTSKLLLEF